MEISEAQKEILLLEKNAALLHSKIKEMRKEKHLLTRKIGALYAFIEGMREPNPKGVETIGL